MKHGYKNLKGVAPTPLSSEDIPKALREHHIKTWRFDLKTNSIVRGFKFDTINDVVCLVNSVAKYAIEIDHHPEWSMYLNNMRISLRTHDTNSVSDKDLYLAKYINLVAKNISKFDKNNFEKLIEISKDDFLRNPKEKLQVLQQ